MSKSIEKRITYFTDSGRKNTEKTLDLAVTYCFENNMNRVVVASSTGRTALELKEKAGDSLDVIAVTYSSGSRFPEEVKKFDGNRDELEKRGIRIVRGLHALSATERAFVTRYKTEFMPLNIVADTLRMFSQGLKVCVEISVMAAEAGLISPAEDVIAIGGSGGGCDTAVLMKPAYASGLFGIKIREIICMPR